jgi:hypothetical protein
VKRRASTHVAWAIFAGALAGGAVIAMFTVTARRNAAPRSTRVAAEPMAVVRPVVAPAAPGPELAPPVLASAAAIVAPIETVAPEPIASPPKSPPSALVATPLGSGPSAPMPSSSVTSVTAVTPNSPSPSNAPISKTCDLALMYAQRGEIAQAIRRFESCLPPDREFVRQRIAQRGAVEVRARAEKGLCDEAAAIVAQIETIEAAHPAMIALASRCDSRTQDFAHQTAEP